MKITHVLLIVGLLLLHSCGLYESNEKGVTVNTTIKRNVCFKLKVSLIPDSSIVHYYSLRENCNNEYKIWQYSLDSLTTIDSGLTMSVKKPENEIDQISYRRKWNSDTLEVDYFIDGNLQSNVNDFFIPVDILFYNYRDRDLKILRYEKRGVNSSSDEIIYFNDSLGVIEIIYPMISNGFSLMQSCSSSSSANIHDVLIGIQKDSIFYSTRSYDIIDVNPPPEGN